MTPRIHSVVFGSVLALAASIAPLAQGQQPAPAPAPAGGSVVEELRALRQLIEQQSKQIDTLTAQVMRLGGELERRNAAPAAAALPATSIEPGSPETAASAPSASSAPPTARVVAPAGNVHIIVKGDSLDKIAKQYNTSITELQKLNKITDPKKLQIGQQISLPAPAPTPEKPQ